MRTATVKEFADLAAKLLRETEPLLITRRGKAVGLYLPLEETQDLPFDLTKNLQAYLTCSVWEAMEEKGLTEGELLEGFERSRK